jgi:hypothetical protein
MGSFHLLPDDQSAIAHLRSVAAALAAHGRYVLDLTFTAADNAIAIEPWSMARGTITVSATAAGIVVDNSATRDHCTLDWGGDLRPYSVASFDRLLQTAEVFAPEATYPEHRTTAEGVTVFDLEHCTAASEGRTIVVLKLA